MAKNPLGESSPIPGRYNPDLLFPISRALARSKLNNFTETRCFGYDLWRAYEISWLDNDRRPEVRIAEFIFKLTSKSIIESKSLKLYLHSLNGEIFDSEEEYKNTLTRDLSAVAEEEVKVVLMPLTLRYCLTSNIIKGRSIDKAENFELHGEPDGEILQISDQPVQSEELYSELFRSLCPITGQPDWATFRINYSGPKISEHSLLTYACSFRDHPSYHEDCGERIFNDISENCKPTDLTISLNFLRRGGIDISVYRSTSTLEEKSFLSRLVRQ